MTRRKTPAGEPDHTGNSHSAENPGQTRAWTDEEMAAAKPLPLPAVDTLAAPALSGVQHAGKGQTHEAGRPEHEAGRPEKDDSAE